MAAEPHSEHDPTGVAPHTPGAKLDAGKAPIFRGLLAYFPRALREVALVSQAGAEKYTWNGWESVADGVNRYADAGGRHILDMAVTDFDDGPHGTGCRHKAQAVWNLLASLELELRQEETTPADTSPPTPEYPLQ